MKAEFILLLLIVSIGAPRLTAQDVPSDAKKQLEAAWTDSPDLCLKALRLLVTNSAEPGAGGINYGLKHAGGLMVFAGADAYKGLAINHNTILVPITAGVG